MTSRSLLALILLTACSSTSTSNSNVQAGPSVDGGSGGGSAADTSDPLTFSACLLGGTGVQSIVLVASSKTECAQVAAYTVVDTSMPAASSRNAQVTTTPSAWAFRDAFAGANAGSCQVGSNFPEVTAISGTITVDPNSASTISANVLLSYADNGPQTMPISADNIAVAPSCN